jgi:hypothetical protein
MLRAVQLSDAEWDTALDRVVMWSGADKPVGVWSPYNYSGWARMKELDGWSFLRVTDDDGLPVAQLLVKRRGPLAVAYAPGGFANATHVDAREYVYFLRRELGAAAVYARVHMNIPKKYCTLDMPSLGWSPVAEQLGAALTLKIRLDHSEDDRREALSFNWRRNLKRSEQHENVVTIESTPSVEDIFALYTELESLKGAHVNSWESSRPHVERFLEYFGPRVVIAKCVSEQGLLRSLRGAVITGGCALDFLAATSYEGRKHYASHATLWALANELARRGVVRYDLGGVDPTLNKGVYDFKHGTGAMEVPYGGEFDAASPALIRSVAGRLAVRFR